MARPRADDWLDVDIAAWKAGGLEVIVSLLEPEEISDLGLQREGALCVQAESNSYPSQFPIAAFSS